MAMARCGGGGGEDEYAKLVRGMNPPRVVIDNEASDDATVIRVDSVSSHGTLLAVVQVIADLDLVIRKAYFSSDGSWFMDVFYVTDRHGLKVLDPHTISYIQTTLEEDDWYYPEEEGMRKMTTVGIVAAEEYTVIELTGTDRPGLLSEVCAVLAAMGCAVRSAELWTHNARVAAVVHVTDAHDPDAAIAADESRVAAITSRLSTLLRSPSCAVRATSASSPPAPLTHMERRLHQMMFDDRDFVSAAGDASASPAAEVTVTPCEERGYTAVVVRCRDRPKLLFDTVCTITDMQYAIHHGAVSSVGEQPAGVAYQEYYIRHVDGEPLTSEAERRRVARCLEAAIERRAVAGGAVALEVRSGDRAGLLSDVTRIFRENGLTIRRAEITTASPEGRGEAVDTFYVSDPAGNPVEAKTIEAIREQIGEATLRVKHNPFAAGDGDGGGSGNGGGEKRRSGGDDVAGSTAFLFGNLFKFYRPFQNFSLIKLYS